MGTWDYSRSFISSAVFLMRRVWNKSIKNGKLRFSKEEWSDQYETVS